MASPQNLLSRIFEKYQSIKDICFTGVYENNVTLLGDRSVVLVTDDHVRSVLQEILDMDKDDHVWKGITARPVIKLWTIVGNFEPGVERQYVITEIEKVERDDITWKSKKYYGLINVTIKES